MYYNSISTFKTEMKAYTSELIRQTSKNIKGQLQSIQSTVVQFSENKKYIDYLYGINNEMDEKSLISNLSSLMISKDFVKKIMVFKPDGTKIEDKTSYEDSKFYTKNGGFFATKEYQDAINGDGKILWATGLNNNYNEIAILVPLYSQNTGQKGALAVFLVEHLVLSNIMTDVKLDNSEIFLVNEHKHIIAHAKGITLGDKVDYLINQGKDEQNTITNGDNLIFLADVNNNWEIVCTLPMTSLLSGIFKANQMSVAVSILCVVIALLITIYISHRFSKSLMQLIELMKTTAEGNFTVYSQIKGNYEVSLLSDSYNAMIHNIRQLIVKNTKMTNLLSGEIQNVNNILAVATSNSRHISSAVEQITYGVAEQAQMAGDTDKIMHELSNLINSVHHSMEDVMVDTNNTMNLNKLASQNVKDLSSQASESIAIIKIVREDASILSKNAAEISQVNAIIDNINAQTNLLALNARIEAARAGDAGRGFGVVAEEIRKLAEDSTKASQNIKNIVQVILKEVDQIASHLESSNEIFQKQSRYVMDTEVAFDKTITSLEAILEHVTATSQSIAKADELRIDAVRAMENITAISEQSAVSTEKVAALTKSNDENYDKLATLSENQNTAATELADSMRKFII